MATVNPLTRLVAMIIITTPLLLSVDWVSAAVSLALTVMLAPLCGMSWPRLVATAWPLLLIAPLSGVSMLLYGAPGGREYFRFLFAVISDNSIELAIAITLRVLAIALPVVILARDIDPTRLGDALAQILHLPARFVLGAVAAVRMATLLRTDWDTLARARRARGVADQGRIRRFAGMAFGLLVVALRRGGRLATAMEARGFGRTPVYGPRRTWARPARLDARDWVVIGVAAAVAAVPVVVSVTNDSWRFLGL